MSKEEAKTGMHQKKHYYSEDISKLMQIQGNNIVIPDGVITTVL